MASSVKATTNRGGRPRKAIDADAIVRLREEGLSWRAVSQKLGMGYGTARRSCLQRAKTPQGEPKPLGLAITATLEPRNVPRASAPSMKTSDWKRQAIIQSCHDILDQPETPTVCRRLERFAFEVGRALKPIEQQQRPAEDMQDRMGMCGDEVSA